METMTTAGTVSIRKASAWQPCSTAMMAVFGFSIHMGHEAYAKAPRSSGNQGAADGPSAHGGDILGPHTGQWHSLTSFA